VLDQPAAQRPRFLRWYRLVGLACVIAALACTGIVVATHLGAQPGTGTAASEAKEPVDDAIAVCNRGVRRTLTEPSTAQFDDDLSSLTGTTWQLDGDVDAKNAHGAWIEDSFSCTAWTIGRGWTADVMVETSSTPDLSLASTNSSASLATARAPASAAARTAYINALYNSVVPAGERAALAGHYLLGYKLPGINCGTGCTSYSNGAVRSSFNATFFRESVTYQRNRIAHEAAHAYGFTHISNYATPSWSGLSGWQTQFNQLDRSFVRTFDAEAWAACDAWQQTGFNNKVNQVRAICTPPAGTFAIAQIPSS
jgi:hypothetical protein